MCAYLVNFHIVLWTCLWMQNICNTKSFVGIVIPVAVLNKCFFLENQQIFDYIACAQTLVTGRRVDSLRTLSENAVMLLSKQFISHS